MSANNIQPIILFDGVCNYCAFWVKFAIKRDRRKRLKFAPLQGPTAGCLLKEFHVAVNPLSSVILIDEGRVYTQSSAAFKMCKYLDGRWKIFYGLMIIPKFLRDAIYDIIARNRYAWFGKTDTCLVPAPDVQDRFLD